jgi:peptidoglycan/xylan/chitin deacetylase (PgdA/CDA1 family)
VLIYHRVGGGSGTEVDLSPQAFDEQMAWLAATGRVVTLDAAIDLLAGTAGGDGRDDPVVVTFDDGTADLADVATPILQRHGVPATVYLVTRHVDEGVDFPTTARR